MGNCCAIPSDPSVKKKGKNKPNPFSVEGGELFDQIVAIISALSMKSSSVTGVGRIDQQGRPLPKFGEWDVNNPASTDGFIVIFAKAKDEKGGGAANGGKQANNSKPEDGKPAKWFCCF
ncbi:AvrRpt-cleavage domain-containing protein [Heracleum sosnowskyi]|uniref:AvrRpt-cleavage domain-containing protein n=1 Tax=Heracleum sosnowskyi TaxID=360622 RepID=A0AAD8I0U4_9APIA|nr:AvrRpt-cleavage domain-containing protein [Heracleum sosnowskyi]